MKKVFWVVVVLVVLGFIVWGGKSKDGEQAMQGENTGPITIGFYGPLTGDAAAYGEVSKNGLAIAVEEINAGGGINGRQVNAVYEDDKCNGADAASAAQKLISVDKVKFIVAGSCSGGVLATASIVTDAKVLTLATLATSPKISGVSPYIMRNAPNDAARGVLLADHAKSAGYKKVAVISEQTDYAQALKETFLAQAAKNGLTVVANENFVSDTQDFKSILAKVKSGSPDAIFINPQTGAAFVRVAQQARQVGVNAPIVGSEFNGPEVTGAGSAVEGAMIAVAPGLASGASGEAFLTAYKKKFGTEPAYAYYSGASYDDMMLIAQGIRAVGDDPTKVRDYLKDLKGYTGTIGTYSFDDKGDVEGIGFVFQKITGGKAVDVK